MSNLNQSPKSSNTVIHHMKQMTLAELVQPHYSYVQLIAHVFENVYIHKGSLNSHSLDSNHHNLDKTLKFAITKMQIH